MKFKTFIDNINECENFASSFKAVYENNFFRTKPRSFLELFELINEFESKEIESELNDIYNYR